MQINRVLAEADSQCRDTELSQLAAWIGPAGTESPRLAELKQITKYMIRSDLT